MSTRDALRTDPAPETGPAANAEAPPSGREAAPGADLGRVGIVIIGRNEGLRLQRCFDTLPAGIRRVVYVDSGSTDDSVAQARRRGVEVVALDMSKPFTAARARNAGLGRLLELQPEIEFVQFVDGDCELLPGWLPQGVATLAARPEAAVVAGRLRERYPEASVYQRLCDMEWDVPAGDVSACGGIAMMRTGPLQDVGGFTESLIAGEEPELCARLRGRGHRVVRIADEMALHDAAMTRFGQFWKRAVRYGHCSAELATLHPAAFRRDVRSVLVWGLAVPVAACAMGVVTGGLGFLLLAVYPAQWLKVLLRRHARGTPLADSALYAASCIVSSWPSAVGVAKYWWSRARGRRVKLIEYK